MDKEIEINYILSIPPCSCSLYFYVLIFFICLHAYTPGREQIKKTKTILRVYMCDTGGVYRRLRHRKKCRQAIKHENFLRHRLLQTPGEKPQYKEKKKDDCPLHILYQNKDI